MIWILVLAISAIIGIVLWLCYMIGFRSTGRHSDVPFIQDDAPWNIIQSMQLIPDAPKMTYYDLDIVSAYPPLPLTSMERLVIQFYELRESITEIGIPAGW